MVVKVELLVLVEEPMLVKVVQVATVEVVEIMNLTEPMVLAVIQVQMAVVNNRVVVQMVLKVGLAVLLVVARAVEHLDTQPVVVQI